MNAGRPSGHHEQSEPGLVPDRLLYDNVPMFAYRTLSTLWMLGQDPVVRQYARANPEAHQAIVALSLAVADAGLRVRDSGQMRDRFEDDPRRFTAGEIWLCDLAIDVAAMFEANGGLGPDVRRDTRYGLEKLDEHVHSHHWQKEVRSAAPGPQEFQALRALVPRHKRH